MRKIFLIILLLSIPLYCQSNLHIPLKWSGGDPDGDTVFYSIYFGPDSANLPLISENQIDTFLIVSGLSYSTKYYWKVIAKDEHGAVTPGPLWRFTTRARLEKPLFVYLSLKRNNQMFLIKKYER